jgi:3'-phosphoadenosine 5'-phosphosulfate (PAPS) 3'-phosphatase
MNFSEKRADVTRKDASPLRPADSASPDSLVESLRSRTPGVPIISVESEDVAEG